MEMHTCMSTDRMLIAAHATHIRMSKRVPQHAGLVLVTNEPRVPCAENQWQQDGEVL